MPNINSAPNMYIDWTESEFSPLVNNMDMVMIDFKCTSDAAGTYWAVNNWDNGYAGFQNKLNKHLLVFSIWEHNHIIPRIEYVSSKGDMTYLTFGGEGNGKHIMTDYNWQVNTWYTMCVGAKVIGIRTYYYQWVKKTDENDWFLTGIISIPETNHYFNKCSLFQEPFDFSNAYRSCDIRFSYVRYFSNNSSVWRSLKKYKVVSKYYSGPNTTPIDNVTENCGWGKGRIYYPVCNYVWLSAGGNQTSGTTTYLPYTYDNVDTPDTLPYTPPEFPPLFTQYIALKNCYSNYYAKPGNNNIIQGIDIYYWRMSYVNGYNYRIITENNTKAISIKTENSLSLELSNLPSNENQHWKSEIVTNWDKLIIKSVSMENYMISLENNSVTSRVGVSDNRDVSRSKWRMFISTRKCSIKSVYSSKFVTPNNTNLTQENNEYPWNIVYAGNGYYYIITMDNMKAITVNGTSDGTALKFDDFSVNNVDQMWLFEKTSDTTESYYIKPKRDINKNMDVRGPSTQPHAIIQLWTHNTTSTQFKWEISDIN